MTSPDTYTTTVTDSPARKPRDKEIDVFGLTHRGHVRKLNQDHFMISFLRKHMDVASTSLPNVDRLSLGSERMGTFLMVADGVGGGSGGEEASRTTLEVLAEYVAQSMDCYYTADATDEPLFANALEEAAMRCHADVVQRAEADPDKRRMATTLTLFYAVWPRAYLLQVGDSRCYIFHHDTLTQITRDQTMAQELLDQGVLNKTDAHNTKWAHVLSSSIGGQQTAPVVTSLDLTWHMTILLCTDGLTKHVSDERIGERLRTMESSKQVCEDLLKDALDDGGSDNVAIVVGRAAHKDEQ